MDYARAVAQVLRTRISEAKTATARATVTAITDDGFVTFTDAMGSTRKGVWVNQQPAIGDVVTYLDEGNGFPLVLGASGARAWIVVGLQNSWANFSADHGFEWASYRKVGDIVYLRGLIKDGTVSATIFTLPAGFRPLHGHLFPVFTDSGGPLLGRLDVTNTGTVTLTSGGNGFVSLSGIHFSTV